MAFHFIHGPQHLVEARLPRNRRVAAVVLVLLVVVQTTRHRANPLSMTISLFMHEGLNLLRGRLRREPWVPRGMVWNCLHGERHVGVTVITRQGRVAVARAPRAVRSVPPGQVVLDLLRSRICRDPLEPLRVLDVSARANPLHCVPASLALHRGLAVLLQFLVRLLVPGPAARPGALLLVLLVQVRLDVREAGLRSEPSEPVGVIDDVLGGVLDVGPAVLPGACVVAGASLLLRGGWRGAGRVVAGPGAARPSLRVLLGAEVGLDLLEARVLREATVPVGMLLQELGLDKRHVVVARLLRLRRVALHLSQLHLAALAVPVDPGQQSHPGGHRSGDRARDEGGGDQADRPRPPPSRHGAFGDLDGKCQLLLSTAPAPRGRQPR
mmetsp:Transcript_102309/g.305495  ORF Transcript_102309/g.305495 Transcript_102309/m.305495 type:complete len:382 (-) Transcript_102309:155-1300(-)